MLILAFMEDIKLFFKENFYYLYEIVPQVIIGIVVVVIFWFVGVKAKNISARRLQKRINDPLLAVFLGRIIKATFIVIGILTAFKITGFSGLVNSILAGAGISAFIIGFALKDIGENFLAGILLAFKRPFKVGDIIETNDVRGQVLVLNISDTQIKTAEGRDVFIPNAMLVKNTLNNYTIDGYLRFDFTIGIDYDSDYKKAIQIIKDAVNTTDGILTDDKEVEVNVKNLSPSSIDIFICYWIDLRNNNKLDITVNQIKNDAILAALDALEKAGINTPGNILELKNYRDKAFITKL